jgi:hypothetical protein
MELNTLKEVPNMDIIRKAKTTCFTVPCAPIKKIRETILTTSAYLATHASPHTLNIEHPLI